MRMTPLDGLGVEIDDVDIKALSADDFAAVKAAFAEHGVIFFRNQDTTENDHIGFAERFGDMALPFDLTALGAPGCSLGVSIDLVARPKLIVDDRDEAGVQTFGRQAVGLAVRES